MAVFYSYPFSFVDVADQAIRFLTFLVGANKAPWQDLITLNPTPGSHVQALLVSDHPHLQAVLLLIPRVLLSPPCPSASIYPLPSSF